ncbi:zinc finger, CCHC-type containing protein [Tanacetum coccineum]
MRLLIVFTLIWDLLQPTIKEDYFVIINGYYCYECGDDSTVEQVMKRNKWDNDDYVCRGLILKGMSDILFDIQQIFESRKELWDSLEAKYMDKDASSKKFFVSNFTNYKITDSRPVMEQHNELLGILGRFTQHKMNMDEAIQEELTLVELGSHLRIEESLRAQDNDKTKGNNVFGPQLNIINNIGKLAFMSTFKLNDSIIRFCYVYLLQSKDEALDKFKVFKTEVELQQGSQIKRFRTDRGGLSQGFWDEAMLTALYLLKRVPNKRNIITPYELWTKRKPNLNYFRVWGCRAVVRLPDPKMKTLGERGIECIFVGYAEHSKAFRFYVIEPNDSVAINSIIKSRDAIFDENRFSSVPRPSLRIPNGTEDIGGLMVPKEVTEEVVQQPESELRKIKRNRNLKDFGPEFQLYLVEGTSDEILLSGKKQLMMRWTPSWATTLVLADLPPGYKPLGCKWIFKRKLKVDGTIEKFKERLVIQGFKQKSGIDYFDTYAPVAHISTIRLLIAMTSIHNLIIHQMDVKTAFLNGDLDEEAPKQRHQNFDEMVLSNGYLLNQVDKYVYRKFDESGKGVIICLYVDDMLIFGTDQVQVDLTKEFLSSKFSMKDIWEADVILGIRIKHESNRIAISQSHYTENVLKKFNYFDCTPVRTPMDSSEKLMPNNDKVVSQLEYTSNPGTQHWQAIQRVLKYLKKTMDYRLTYTGYPLVLEDYIDASWISNTEDNSSTSGWVFFLGGGAISWASKKKTCITGLTIESEFVALASACKEAE